MVARISVLAVLSGCADQLLDPAGDGRDGARYAEGSPEAELILRAANELSLEVLDVEVGLDSRAANNLVAERAGVDGLDGTTDDTPFEALAAVDAVPYVGEAAMEAMLVYARDLWASGGAVHGIEEGSPEAALILEVANTASHHVLEDRLDISELAACSIVEGRVGPDGLDGTADDTPFATLTELDAAEWVDAAVFEALLAYGQSLPPEVDCPAGFIVSSDGKTMFSDLKSAAEQSPAGTVLEVCAGEFTGAGIAPQSVTLRGRGKGITTFRASSSGQLFVVPGGRTVTIEGVSIVGNSGTYSTNGAINTAASSTLVVRDSEFTGHKLYYGGGIYAYGRVELYDVTFANNVATYYGGALYARDVVVMEDVTFTGNSANYGGAVYVSDGTVSGQRVDLIDNAATTSGGAIYAVSTSAVDLLDSTLLSNTASTGGAVSVMSSSTFDADTVDFGWMADYNSVGDVYTGSSGAVFHYGDGVTVSCTATTCL